MGPSQISSPWLLTASARKWHLLLLCTFHWPEPVTWLQPPAKEAGKCRGAKGCRHGFKGEDFVFLVSGFNPLECHQPNHLSSVILFLLTRREHLSLPLIQGRRQEMALKESHIVGILTSSLLHVGHVTFMYSLRICEPLSLSAKGGSLFNPLLSSDSTDCKRQKPAWAIWSHQGMEESRTGNTAGLPNAWNGRMSLVLWMCARCHGPSAPRYTHPPSSTISLNCISEPGFKFLRKESDWTIYVSCILLVQSMMARRTLSYRESIYTLLPGLGAFHCEWGRGSSQKDASAWFKRCRGIMSERPWRTIKCCINISWLGNVGFLVRNLGHCTASKGDRRDYNFERGFKSRWRQGSCLVKGHGHGAETGGSGQD